MTTRLTKQLVTVALGATFGLLGLASVNTTAHAASIAAIEKADYVKTTRAMYTGQYTYVNGKKGHKIITPKGTILRTDGVGSERTSSGSIKYSINLSRGDLHYNSEKGIYETGKPISFKASDYKVYKLKMGVRTHLLQSGTGFTNDSTNDYKPMFHVTLDGYVEYYSAARLKHYKIQDPDQSTNLFDLPNGSNTSYAPAFINRIKPTASVKVSTFKIKGNTAYLYYKKPIYGLTEKKVSSRYYRLTIKQTAAKISKTWTQKFASGDADYTTASWARYSVGGHNYYDILSVERGD
ncbi:hypothetical protein FD04_GL000413 [Secundilactobacillus odoratitofui DSM 19909 = JCM 15043]|uniref:Surface layer protein A domain-containing protein n=1 Tax=Secundilactobacillus odoratitofui DSM 19909 = JCM 15043 TaxID=1423776 RepID=A0A0R1LSE4_9LACO|nr:hypothetical protein [Secundilactobacillus odoratitofui]KRK98678.1 hypothetical protein FD04_GL000413 [Secundilactobacillus odoratitofui DSM 19909 = JCM 15043]